MVIESRAFFFFPVQINEFPEKYSSWDPPYEVSVPCFYSLSNDGFLEGYL